MRYKIFITWFPFIRDLNEGGLFFIKPRFGKTVLKGTPCKTNWLYDWILHLGYLSIYRKSDYQMKG